NKPHFSPPQARLARNVHAETAQQPGQRSFVVTKTPVRAYDVPSSAFLDVINDIPQADPGVSQCLRIRASSRRRKAPACGEDGIYPPPSRDPETGELEEEGMDEEYEDGDVETWPPAPDAQGGYSEAGKELHALMNPPGYVGKVQGTFDEGAFVYSTGQEGGQKAIVMVNFDPAVHLHGLRKCSMDSLRRGYAARATSQSQESSGRGSPKRPNSSLPSTAGENAHSPKRAKTSTSSPASAAASTAAGENQGQGQDSSWLRREAAMYLSIARGFDFGL
ncbi:hypothetical protein O988_03709, partial [Pseudogymnoascus sp. VKM F-3808]